MANNPQNIAKNNPEKSVENEVLDSENYFERINFAIEKAGGIDEIDEKKNLDSLIKKESKKEKWGIASKILDFFENPKEGMKYLLSSSFSFLPNWMKSAFGLQKDLTNGLDTVQKTANNLLKGGGKAVETITETAGNAQEMMGKFLPPWLVKTVYGSLGIGVVKSIFFGKSDSLVGNLVGFLNPFSGGKFKLIASAGFALFVLYDKFGDNIPLDKNVIKKSLAGVEFPGKESLDEVIDFLLSPNQKMDITLMELKYGIDSEKMSEDGKLAKNLYEKSLENNEKLSKKNTLDDEALQILNEEEKSFSNSKKMIGFMREQTSGYFSQVASILFESLGIKDTSEKAEYEKALISAGEGEFSNFFDKILVDISDFDELLQFSKTKEGFKNNKEKFLKVHKRLTESMFEIDMRIEEMRQKAGEKPSLFETAKGLLWSIPGTGTSFLLKENEEGNIATLGIAIVGAGIGGIVASKSNSFKATKLIRVPMAIGTFGLSEVGLKGADTLKNKLFGKITYKIQKSLINKLVNIQDGLIRGGQGLKVGGLQLIGNEKLDLSSKNLAKREKWFKKGFISFDKTYNTDRASATIFKEFLWKTGLGQRGSALFIKNAPINLQNFVLHNSHKKYFEIFTNSFFSNIGESRFEKFLKILENDPKILKYLENPDIEKFFNKKPDLFLKAVKSNKGMIAFMSEIPEIRTYTLDIGTRINSGEIKIDTSAPQTDTNSRQIFDNIDDEIKAKKAEMRNLGVDNPNRNILQNEISELELRRGTTENLSGLNINDGNLNIISDLDGKILQEKIDLGEVSDQIGELRSLIGNQNTNLNDLPKMRETLAELELFRENSLNKLGNLELEKATIISNLSQNNNPRNTPSRSEKITNKLTEKIDSLSGKLDDVYLEFVEEIKNANGDKNKIAQIEADFKIQRAEILGDLGKSYRKFGTKNLALFTRKLGNFGKIILSKGGIAFQTFEAARMIKMFASGDSKGAWETAYRLAPITGTFMDGKDAYKYFKNGDIKQGLISSGFTVVGGIFDVLMFTGVGTAVGVGGRAALASARGAKVALKAKTLGKIGKLKGLTQSKFGRIANNSTVKKVVNGTVKTVKVGGIAFTAITLGHFLHENLKPTETIEI